MAPIEAAMDDSSKTIPLAEALLQAGAFAKGAETVRISGNVRAVGFISKPRQIRELKTCIEGSLIDLLRQVPGFAGALVLHAQKESRNLLVLTFWEAESQAAKNCWEEFSTVRDLLAQLIDMCTKVQTFHATLPQPFEGRRQGKAAAVC